MSARHNEQTDTPKSRKSAQHGPKRKAQTHAEDQGRRSLQHAVQPEPRPPALLSSTSSYELYREPEVSPRLPLSPSLEITHHPLQKGWKKQIRRRGTDKEELKQNSAEKELFPSPTSRISMQEARTSATDSTAGIPQVSSNLPTLSNSDEEGGPPPNLFRKDARLKYDYSFILSFRDHSESLLIPEDLVPITKRSIRPIRANCWLGESHPSPVLCPAQAPAEIPSWRRGETEEEKTISQQAKVQTERLTSEKSDLEVQQRSIKVTLNKLSLDNFHKLKERLLDLAKESDATMQIMTKMVFEKAFSQAKYTKLYAELCLYLDSYYASLCPSLAESRKNVRKYLEIQRVFTEFMSRSLHEQPHSRLSSAA